MPTRLGVVMNKYTLTLTSRQAAEISSACEIVARLQMGQVDMALRELPGGQPKDYDALREIQQMIERLVPAKIERGDSIAWDLYQVIRHRLSWDQSYESGEIEKGEQRKWPEMMGVNYDEPMKKGDEPLAVIVGGVV